MLLLLWLISASVTSWCGALSPAFVGFLELLKVLVQPVSQQDLSTAALSALHLHDHLSTSHLDLLLLHSLATFLHLLDLLLVTSLLGLALLPLLVGDACHDFHRLLGLFLLLVNHFLIVIYDLLLVFLSMLFDQTLLEPIFEGLVSFLLLDLFLEALSLLLSQLGLLLECLLDKLALFPLVHAMASLLVLLIECCLLHDHLLKEIFLGLVHQDFAEALLMLLNSQPIVMTNLSLGDLILI